MLQEHEYTVEEAKTCLHQVWGYEDFRPGQKEAIEAILRGNDVLAILPTGGGKSMCYYVPTLLCEGLALVVSPLIALMEDQVAHLRARNIPAAFINSTLSRRRIDQIWTNAEYGQYRFLYVAPERLQSNVFRARVERLPVTLLAVDEAHCVSQWGHHFRPDYMLIPEARRLLGDPQVVAVTATATPQVRREVINHLELEHPEVIVKGFDRPNIVWSIFRTENKRGKLFEVVGALGGSGIVYAATRRGVDQVASWLEDEGVPACAYHGGMKKDRRARVQTAWIEGERRVVVATNAFGMGIDKPDVRFVIHYDMPGSLEAYYQEAGRAGRDGRQAYAVLLYRPGDEETQQRLIEASHPDASEVREVYDAVCNLAQIPVGDCPDEPVLVNIERVADLTGLIPSVIRTATRLLEQQEVWQTVPLRRHHGVIRFCSPAKEVRSYAASQSNPRLKAFVMDLLRTVRADAFRDWWDVDLSRLEHRTGLPRTRLLRGLAFLGERGLVDWIAPQETLRLYLTAPRSAKLPVDDTTVRRDCRRALVRLNDMLRYTRSVTCRRRVLLGYFGEAASGSCGTCDICLGRHKKLVITPEQEPVLRKILGCIEKGRLSEARLDGTFELPAHRIDELLNWLIQEEYVRVENAMTDELSLTDKAHQWLDGWS